MTEQKVKGKVKGSRERICLFCEQGFSPLRSTKKYCSGKCRSSHFNEKRMWDMYITTIIFEEKKEKSFFKKLLNLIRTSRIAYR